MRTWTEFKTEVTERFHCKQAGDEYEQLMALRQEGTVSEYRERFEALSAPLENATEEMLRGAFMNGLAEELKCDVKLMQPKNLKELMNYAGQVEERNLVSDRLQEKKEHRTAKNTSGARWSEFRPNPFRYSLSEPIKTHGGYSAVGGNKGGEDPKNHSEASQVASNGGGGSSSTQYSRRRLSEAEINRRRELGLCFHGEEKYGPNHRLKNKQLRVIMLEEPTEEAQVDAEAQEAAEPNDEMALAVMELAMTTTNGLTGTKALKMLGRMKGAQVVVLVDCGATHNFVSLDLVERLDLPTQRVLPYLVTLGDGRRVKSDSQCPNVLLEIQGMEIVQTFYPFQLGNVDVVLGIDWLATLGETQMNWEGLYMKVRVDGQWRCLVGDPALT